MDWEMSIKNYNNMNKLKNGIENVWKSMPHMISLT